MMSFELLLDPLTDACIRAEWEALLAAGLPSQGRHTGASNAPHVTLLAARAVDAALGTPPALPVAVHLSGLVVFGTPPRGLVLARLVAVSHPLQELQTEVHRWASGVVDLSEQTAPGRWMPHITLASRLSPAQLAGAIEVLASDAVAPIPSGATSGSGTDAGSAAPAGGRLGSETRVVTLRHWNGDTKTVTVLASGWPVPVGAASAVKRT